MRDPDLAPALVRAALELGFCRAGVTSACAFEPGRARLAHWLEAGHHGSLEYMAGEDRADPRALLPAARSMIVVALSTPSPVPSPVSPEPRGRVASYARGSDYHRVMKDKLGVLAARAEELAGRKVESRIAVDTAPLLERDAAVRAGLGFICKSMMLIVPGVGTNVVLGELLLDLELVPSAPAVGSCGECRACLDACPTQAFAAPFVLDARRCISFLSIEHHGVIPLELRPAVGTRVFGCDECQAVCPYDASASPRAHAPELAGRIPEPGLDLAELLCMGNAGYRKLVKRTALRRVSRDVLARNAAVAMGNAGDRRFAAELEQALDEHPSPLVRAHAAWALGQYGAESRARLERALAADPDESVREEARAALAALDGD